MTPAVGSDVAVLRLTFSRTGKSRRANTRFPLAAAKKKTVAVDLLAGYAEEAFH